METTKRRGTAIIWEEPGANPETDRIGFGSGDDRTTLVAVAEPSSAVELARELADDGAERIELCGAFGPVWQAKAMEAVGDEVPVGAITYGFESIVRIADFKARFEAGERMAEAFIFIEEGADPDVDRVVREDEHAKTTFVAVPEASAASEVAKGLAGEGAQLIELYGGLGPESAAKVIEAVEARVPVGFASYEPQTERRFS